MNDLLQIIIQVAPLNKSLTYRITRGITNLPPTLHRPVTSQQLDSTFSTEYYVGSTLPRFIYLASWYQQRNSHNPIPTISIILTQPNSTLHLLPISYRLSLPTLSNFGYLETSTTLTLSPTSKAVQNEYHNSTFTATDSIPQQTPNIHPYHL